MVLRKLRACALQWINGRSTGTCWLTVGIACIPVDSDQHHQQLCCNPGCAALAGGLLAFTVGFEVYLLLTLLN